ncbi:P-loop NTPase fold protein [Marinomonas sp. TI.3.20]|uniref:KAP family P-loop NTPase fold protein n=1 Tax=Marinomonas sp. TI.3.20 TaxID=3121296 RepID=UPI00311F6BE2
MFTKDSIDWSDPTTIDDEDFPKDTLGRQRYAQFLTKFLVDQGYDSSRDDGEDKRNYVLNLNSEWGSGKTYFLKRWSKDLKPHFPVVYIDAWKQDYSDDPLMTVISSVIKQLTDQADIKKKPNFEVPKRVVGLFKAAAPALIKTFSKKYFGDEDFIDLSDVAAGAVTHLLDEHEEKSQAIDDLKISVAEWVSFITDNPEDEKAYPAFIFIDELDRCRPSYAVEMLETIKHIFDIKGIVFVVATDTEQLQHAVKAIYGEGFDARLYLGRFFNSRFSLKAPDLKNFLEVHVDHHKLSGEYLKKAGISILPPNEDGKVTLDNIAVILDAFNMPPRTAIQITDRIIATLSNMPFNSNMDIILLTSLLCINEQDNNLFKNIISGSFKDIDESSKSIDLKAFLDHKFQDNKDTLKITIKIEDYASLFINESNYQKAHKKQLQTPYSFSFKKYLSEPFLNDLGIKNNNFGALMGEQSRGQKLSPIQKIIQKIEENNFVKNPPDSISYGLLWCKAQFYLGQFDRITKEQYKDYVELASALDWIDGDSDANDA